MDIICHIVSSKMHLLISIVSVENPEWIYALLSNYEKYVHVPYTVCINTNHALHERFPANVHLSSPIIKPYRGGNGILYGLYENMRYALNNNLSFDYVVMLASNCLFFQPITAEFLSSLDYWKSQVSKTQPVRFHSMFKGYHNKRDPFFHQMMQRMKWTQAYFHQWEGLIFTRSIASEMVQILSDNNMFETIRQGVAQEEAYLPTILWNTVLKQATQSRDTPMRMVDNICRFYWELPNYMPSISHIQELIDTGSRYRCVKRVERDKENAVFQFIMK